MAPAWHLQGPIGEAWGLSGYSRVRVRVCGSVCVSVFGSVFGSACVCVPACVFSLNETGGCEARRERSTSSEMSEVTLMSPWCCYLERPHLTHRGISKLEIDALIVELNCPLCSCTFPPTRCTITFPHLHAQMVLWVCTEEDVFSPLKTKTTNAHTGEKRKHESIAMLASLCGCTLSGALLTTIILAF